MNKEEKVKKIPLLQGEGKDLGRALMIRDYYHALNPDSAATFNQEGVTYWLENEEKLTGGASLIDDPAPLRGAGLKEKDATLKTRRLFSTFFPDRNFLDKTLYRSFWNEHGRFLMEMRELKIRDLRRGGTPFTYQEKEKLPVLEAKSGAQQWWARQIRSRYSLLNPASKLCYDETSATYWIENRERQIGDHTFSREDLPRLMSKSRRQESWAEAIRTDFSVFHQDSSFLKITSAYFWIEHRALIQEMIELKIREIRSSESGSQPVAVNG